MDGVAVPLQQPIDGVGVATLGVCQKFCRLFMLRPHEWIIFEPREKWNDQSGKCPNDE
jgi:hypothetical protein